MLLVRGPPESSGYMWRVLPVPPDPAWERCVSVKQNLELRDIRVYTNCFLIDNMWAEQNHA